ncbi:hypothetical protein LNP74_05365 [Klebsiella pneumoniae subsp. pneumoniae]|nr:hypothetical protein [Klebsiella pneumoniae subsp. pneumoniae]
MSKRYLCLCRSRRCRQRHPARKRKVILLVPEGDSQCNAPISTKHPSLHARPFPR